MDPKDQQMVIAEYCGWKEAFPSHGDPHPETKRGGILLPYKWVNEKTHERVMDLPDYLNDLNAMHIAEKMLKPERVRRDGTYTSPMWEKYFMYGLLKLAERDNVSVAHLEASQRAEAFVRTIEKWVE